jgi:serine protease AprX
MRPTRGTSCGVRSNALWGRGGRKAGVLVTTTALVFAFAAAAGAGVGNGPSPGPSPSHLKAFVPSSLLSAIQQSPTQTFDVIVQGDKRGDSNGLFQQLAGDNGPAAAFASRLTQRFRSIDGLHGTLTGRQIQLLANLPFVSSIVPNETVEMSAVQLPTYNTQLWPWVAGAPVDWTGRSPQTPTIAIVDSGIDASRNDFGGRVLGQVNIASLSPTATGDDYGHGTFVAGIAADSAPGYAGVSPKSNLLSIRVMNGQGEATVSDIVSACDWILANKSTYNIRVVNMSFHAVNRASVLFDPLDQAVEKLWLNGVVVVTAAGNYATNGQSSGVPFAPANDPFVITVGAADVNKTITAADDVAAPWSAYGYTADGFAKPDVAAPGRYLIGPVSPGATLATQRPGSVTAPGYMQLSGTSFAAPVVAGEAAELLAQHPSWTPDQVKGAIMVTANPTLLAAAGSLGVGEANIARARHYARTPPNPNAGLDQFLTTAADGSTVFNGAAWQSAALSNAAWNSAAWGSAAWSDAAWASAAWASAAWSDAAWSSAAWGSAAWSDAAWSDAAWSDAAWSDGALSDPTVDPSQVAASDADQSAVEAELGIVDPNCDPTIDICQAVAPTLP